MNETPATKLNGKILFGCDFLHLTAFMEISESQADKRFRPVISTIAQFFLLQWGFSFEEQEASKSLILEKLAAKTEDTDINMVIDRIIRLVNNDRSAQERLIIELSAIACINNNISEEETNLPEYLRKKFDIRPSEYKQLQKTGFDWARGFEAIGFAYIETNNQFKDTLIAK